MTNQSIIAIAEPTTTTTISMTTEQIAAINEFERPVLAISPPGTGKTTVVTFKYKAAVDKWGHGSAVAITFTRKAANEIKDRLAKMGCPAYWTDGQSPLTKNLPTTGTFHSIATRILAIASVMKLYDGPTVMATPDEIERALNEAKSGQADTIPPAQWITGKPKDNLRTCLDRAKNGGNLPTREGYANIDKPRLDVIDELPNPGSAMHQRMVRYQESLYRQFILDYDDALIQATLMLEQHRDRILPFLKAVIVDEYQDVNEINERFITALSNGISLTCCGDDDQAIYHWRGARVEYIQSFETRHANTLLITLQHNFRSTPGITVLAHRVMEGVRGRINKPAPPTNNTAIEIPATLHLYQSRALVYNPMNAGFETGLSTYAAEVCDNLIAAGASPSDIIVLVRTNDTAKKIRDSIEDLGHHGRVSSPNELDSYELRSLTSWLRLLQNSSSEGPISQLARIPTDDRLIRDLSQVARIEGKPLIQLLTERLASKKLRDTRLKEVVTAYLTITADRDSLSNVELLDRACQVVAAGSLTSGDQNKIDHFWKAYASVLPTLQDGGNFQNAIELLQTSLSNDDIEDTVPFIEVSTMHAVKGRQKKIVVIAALADGIMPSRMALVAGTNSKEVEEERRLTYVAISRAQEHLHVISVANAPSYLNDLIFGPKSTKVDLPQIAAAS